MTDNPHIGMKFSDYLDGEGVRVDVEGEALTRLASIMAADQNAAEIEDTAGMVGRYYERLISAGMSAEAAENGAAEYQSLLLAQRFMDVHQKLGISIMLEGE